MLKHSSMLRFAFIAAFAVLFLSVPTKQAQAACSAPGGVAGEIIYNSSNNILQYCDNTNWIGLGGNGQGYTMVSGWPDVVMCNITNPAYGKVPLYLMHAPLSSTGNFYYRSVYNPGGNVTYDAIYTPAGAFGGFVNITTGDCNTSISALYAAGKAFNFVGGGSGGGGSSQWADVSGGINYSAGNTGVGVADPTYGITYAPSKVLGVTGDGSAAITSKGVLTLANNRATPSATDILGNIDWISQGNGGTANSQIASRIWVTNAGGGGGNGFGSNMSFYTKGDNVATLAERVRIDYTGSMTIGAANADANAVLDVASTTKGLLLPRVPAATLTAMTTPTNGLIAYDSTNHVIKLRANGAWVSLSTSSGAGGGGNTMVTGWPDAIRCSTTSYGTRSLYLAGSPAADGNYYYVDPVYNSQTLTVGFTSAGAYNAAVLGPNMGTTDCNVSIVALYTAGKAFNFIGNTSSAAAGAANEIQFREGGNLQADASFVYDNVNDRVGLGAAVPVSKLHLTTAARTTAFDAANGATWHDLVIQNPTQDLNAATGIALELHGTYNANGATGIAAVKAVDGTDRGSDMVFITRPQAAASAERMRITSAGNVGIGVSTIGANNKLHIRGGTALSGAAINAQSLLVLEGGTDYGNGNVNMHILSSSTKNAQIVFGNEVSSAPGVISYQNAINELAFTANSVATLRLGGTGNVGIGAAPGVDATYPKLQVGGAIVSTVNNAAAATAINFASSNVAYTTAACGAFTLTNMADGGSYSLIVKGSGTGPATFTHTGLTVKTPGTLTCTSAKHTVFSFIRAGTDVYVTMITGY